jgi:hypothetical protein
MQMHAGPTLHYHHDDQNGHQEHAAENRDGALSFLNLLDWRPRPRCARRPRNRDRATTNVRGFVNHGLARSETKVGQDVIYL